MKRRREQARRWTLRELDRRLHPRGLVAIKAETDPNASVNLDAAVAQQQDFDA
jgi:hypothetical protein